MINGGVEIFAPHQDQWDLESVTPHIEYPRKVGRNIFNLTHSLTWNPRRGQYFQNVDQLHQDTGFDASGCGHVDQYAQGDNYALQGLGTRTTRSVENFLVLHFVTRKP